MLPPEPVVIAARQGFLDAQLALSGFTKLVGYYSLGWYGTDVSDERGSFAIVNALGALSAYVGSFVQLHVGSRSVNVYVIGGQTNLLADILVTRRAYMAVALLAEDPVTTLLAVLS